jgi:hypothetical protein
MYRIYKLHNRTILAIPEAPRYLRLAAVSRYQPVTLRKALFQTALRGMIALGVDWFLASRARNPLPILDGFEFSAWLEHVRRSLQGKHTYAVVIWPPQFDRNRVYVHFIDDKGRPRAFAKLSFDEPNDILLHSEAQALKSLKVLGLKLSYQPELLDFAKFEDHTFLLLEPLPSTGSLARPSPDQIMEIIREYSGPPRYVPPEQVQQLSWWHAFTAVSARAPRFQEHMLGAIANGLRVCRVHGDFGAHNIVLDAGRLWLYDWEHSSPDGPSLVDYLSRELSDRQRFFHRRPFEARNWFAATYMGNSSTERANEIIAALGYLAAMGKSTAITLIESWEMLRKPPRPANRKDESGKQILK